MSTLVQGYSNAGAAFSIDGITAKAVAQIDGNGAFTAAVNTTAIAAAVTNNTVVRTGPGRLGRVVVTSAGSGNGATLIYDSATGTTGTIIAAVPQNAAVGSVLHFDMPASVGITVGGNSGNPAMTISYS